MTFENYEDMIKWLFGEDAELCSIACDVETHNMVVKLSPKIDEIMVYFKHEPANA